MKQKKPNIIVIMSDQHNPHILGCTGNDIVRTPNLDKLAQTGTNFTNAYTPSPLCVPARMSFMTGEYGSDINVVSNRSQMTTDVPTFAHALGGAGYEAVLCGRMHFSGHDQFHGFEKRIHGDCWNYLTPETMGKGNETRTTSQKKYAVEVAGHGKNGFLYFDKVVTEKACDFIKSNGSDDRPYCLVVGLIAPHNPLICRKELFDYYYDKLDVPEIHDKDKMEKLHPAVQKWRERREVNDLTTEQHHRALAAYYGLTEEMDENVGKIMESIEGSSEADNTIIIYTSDHGDMAAEQGGMWWKSSFFEGSVGIPLLINDKRVESQKCEVKSIVNLIDVTATMLDYADTDVLNDISGKSLQKFLTEDEESITWQNETFSEFFGAHGDLPSCMLRKDEWKLIYYSEFDSVQLFNIDKDPDETTDLADKPEHIDMIKEMLNKIHTSWSAEEMIVCQAEDIRRRKIVETTGHDLYPHEVIDEEAPEGENSFDYGQLPNCDDVLRRLGKI
ncbi:MAG: sulfatase-like hydrolase/transferase [Planctomycetota bacterium]|jgi:choline-sulfatase